MTDHIPDVGKMATPGDRLRGMMDVWLHTNADVLGETDTIPNTVLRHLFLTCCREHMPPELRPLADARFEEGKFLERTPDFKRLVEKLR